MSRALARPIAMFVDQSDSASIEASVDAGVSAYIVDGLKKERINPVLDLCVSRFNAFARLQAELERTKSALEERKVIDRAKGLLMKIKGMTEDEAMAMVVRGFVEPIARELPMEYALELNRLIELQMEGSVG